MPTTFTIALQTDKPLSAYGPLAAQIESSGFDGVSVYNDLLYQPAWLPLLEIAHHTNRIRVGPAAVNPFTCHPLNIAGNIALIDEASHGRAYCGFARGAWLDFIGLTVAKPVTAVREAMICVRHLLSGSKAPLAADQFPLAGGERLKWSGIRPDIPFLLGSWGPRLMEACLPFVAEIKLGGTTHPGAVRWVKSILGGRKINIVTGAVTVVDEDAAAARRLARREAALYLPVIADLDPSLTIEPERLAGIRQAMASFDVDAAASFISDDLLRNFAFVGTPQEIINQSLTLMEAGAHRLEFGTPHGVTTKTGLDLLGKVVLPQLKEAVI